MSGQTATKCLIGWHMVYKRCMVLCPSSWKQSNGHVISHIYEIYTSLAISPSLMVYLSISVSGTCILIINFLEMSI